MPKSTDVPHELRPLNKLFSEKDYKWDFADSFRDWVEFLTESFMPVPLRRTGQGEYERLKKKHGDLDWFVRMTHEFVRVQHQMIVGPQDWYDALGTFYEVLAGNGKRSIMGQFFTPPEVCDMMSLMQGANESLIGQRKTVNDPCSGSGRLLLAFHAKAPGNYQFGADLDSICARMTAVNMCMHGCVGQAVCMNALDPDDWRFGYHINRRLTYTGIPTIEPMAKEECRSWQYWQAQLAKPAPKQQSSTPAPSAVATPLQEAPIVLKNGQFSLF